MRISYQKVLFIIVSLAMVNILHWPASAQDQRTRQITPAIRAVTPAQTTLPTELQQRLNIDEAKMRGHVMRPPNIEGIISYDGVQQSRAVSSLRSPGVVSATRPQATTAARPQGTTAIGRKVTTLPNIPNIGQIAAGPQLIAAGPQLDVDAFCPAVHDVLKDSVAGYVLRLQQNGSTICTLQWQWSKTPGDGSQGWNPDTHMHIASVSKLITAISLTKLLDDENISYNAKIIDYLPSYWQKGPNIDKITFRHLMTQRSGFSTGSSKSDYEFMKSKVAAGVSGVGSYDYENMNFGLARILMPIIEYGYFLKNFTMSDQSWDYITIQAYVEYLQKNVFGPSGVTGATMAHPSHNALAYNFPVSGGGWNSGDLTSVIGGAGWHMSVNEVLKVMDTFRRKGSIMSSAKAQSLLDNMFGIDQVINTSAGKLYNKNGAWGKNGRREQSVAYFLPQGMELMVLVNSPIGTDNKSLRGLIADTYKTNIK